MAYFVAIAIGTVGVVLCTRQDPRHAGTGLILLLLAMAVALVATAIQYPDPLPTRCQEQAQ